MNNIKNTDILEHWYHQYFNNIDKKILDIVAWSDYEAFSIYKNYRWVYDKELLSNILGYKVLKLEDYKKCNFYPVIVKPKINMEGMSKWAYKVNAEEYLNLDRKNMIMQSFFTGNHLTTDFCVRKGKILDFFTFKCHKNSNGSFYLFESIDSMSLSKHLRFDVCNDEIKPIYKFIEKTMIGYTGFINVETIGNNIIEIHLRPSIQYFDICGDMLENFCNYLYKSKDSILPGIYEPAYFEKTYSKVYRKKYNCKPLMLNIPKFPEHIRSIQKCFDNNCLLSDYSQDEFSYVYMVINGTNINSIKRFGKVLDTRINFKKVI